MKTFLILAALLISATSYSLTTVSQTRTLYTSTSAPTGSYLQLIASTAAVANTVEIFDSSGQTLVLAVGPSGSEIPQFNILPGGNGQIPFLIPAGSRVSVKGLSGVASAGENDLNLYGN